MNRKVDLIINYILAAAGQQDGGNRELGPIHLVKYVYLADLAFADSHDGRTFTGVAWRFHHFGPWSEHVFERLQPIALETGAVERRIPSKFADDAIRWTLENADLFEELDEKLPPEITRCVKQAIHRFGQDTVELLDFVYTTRPMLRAAPGEVLKFDPAVSQDATSLAVEPRENVSVFARVAEPLAFLPSSSEPLSASASTMLSKAAQKRRAEKIRALREKVRAKLKAPHRLTKLLPPSPEPRYDAVYAESVELLNEQAAGGDRPTKGELVFSPQVWKSRARGDDLS